MASSAAKSRSPEALKHAWDWFDLHAKQRMQTINFYIVLVGAIIAGSGAAIKDEQYAFSALLGVVLVLVSALFFAMDRRARILVRVGEAALRQEEDALASATGNKSLSMVEASDRSSARSITYGQIFYAMFVAFGLVGAAILTFSLVKYASGPKDPGSPPVVFEVEVNG